MGFIFTLPTLRASTGFRGLLNGLVRATQKNVHGLEIVIVNKGIG